MLEKINQAIKILQNKGMIIITDDEKRENEGDIVFAAEFANQENINFCIKYASGVIAVAINESIATRLNLSPMEKENTDPFYTAFYSSLDADPQYGITTGISALQRSITINMIADENCSNKDFRKPGHVFPVVAKKYGLFERMGHTEAAVDMMKIANLKLAAVICESMDAKGDMLNGKNLIDFAKKHDILIISTQEIKQYRLMTEKILICTAGANIPTLFGEMRMLVYQNPINKIEHIVMIKNHKENFENQKPIIRIHSECITSEVFFSQKCDCKQQLETSMKAIIENQCGAVIYLRGHEGRGIGITGKIKAYALQEIGLNTIQANEELGFPVDSRDFIDAISILQDLKVKNFSLYTGNPKKIEFLKNYGFIFDIITPKIDLNLHNSKYLKDKQSKMGHDLILNQKK